MSTVGRRRIGRALCSLAWGLLLLAAQGIGLSYAEDCRYFSALPDDCAPAAFRKFDGLRDYRYEEIDLFAKDPLKKVLYVSVYNTTGLNGGDDSTTRLRRNWRRDLTRRGSPRNIKRSRCGLGRPITGLWTGLPIASAQSGASMVSMRRGWETASRRAPRSHPSPRPRQPIIPPSRQERPFKGSTNDLKSIFLTTPRAELG